MKALTLWQPYASLVALGLKSIETRSWATLYRGPLAIHAAARRPLDWPAGAGALGPRVQEAIQQRGVVVATCRLASVVEIKGANTEQFVLPGGARWFIGAERAFGDYAPGRYAWLLADVKSLEEPVPAKGRQQLWEWAGP